MSEATNAVTAVPRYEGGCLCGAVRYRVDAEPGPLVLCHCSRCRKASGSAFMAIVQVPAAAVHVDGEEAMRVFQSSPGVFRQFCGHCGSPLFTHREGMPDILRLRAGTLDTPLLRTPEQHVFVGSKAPWDLICDQAPRHQEGLSP